MSQIFLLKDHNSTLFFQIMPVKTQANPKNEWTTSDEPLPISRLKSQKLSDPVVQVSTSTNNSSWDY